jgi:hypothetical protein
MKNRNKDMGEMLIEQRIQQLFCKIFYENKCITDTYSIFI